MRSQQRKTAAHEALRICKRLYPWRALVGEQLVQIDAELAKLMREAVYGPSK